MRRLEDSDLKTKDKGGKAKARGKDE